MMNRAGKFAVKAIMGIVPHLLLAAALLFISAGTIRWGYAWAFLGAYFGVMLIGVFVLARNVDLATERRCVKGKPDVKKWDRILAPILAFIGPLSICLVGGLDFRFGWSFETPPLACRLGGAALMILGSGFSGWAMHHNRFYSAMVRIQRDRGHTVIRSGPYRFIRHPGYAGVLVYFMSVPLILGSWWAFIPAGLTASATLIRTVLEDRTLQAELPGYLEYTQQTRRRLLPGIW